MHGEQQDVISYSYKDTEAYRKACQEEGREEADSGERKLFELPSERAARQQRRSAPLTIDASAQSSVDASRADDVSSLTVSLREFFWFFAYCEALYGCSDIPGAWATVTMPLRDRDRFLRFRADPSPVIAGGRPRTGSCPSEDATIMLSIRDLAVLERYWREICEGSDAFDPAIVIAMPHEERAKFDDYVACRENPGASASHAEREADREEGRRSGCLQGCKTMAIVFIVGIAIFAAIAFALPIAFNAFSGEDSQAGSRDGAEKVLVGRIWKAGESAYVSQVVNPAVQDEALTYLFAPAGIMQSGDKAFLVTTELRLNPDDTDSSERGLFNDASIVGAMEAGGYDALHRAVYDAVFDHDPGARWVLYAFDISTADSLGDQVDLLIFDEDELVKTFTYHVQHITLDELESIAQAYEDEEE